MRNLDDDRGRCLAGGIRWPGSRPVAAWPNFSLMGVLAVPNQFFNDTWMVGIWRAGHVGANRYLPLS